MRAQANPGIFREPCPLGLRPSRSSFQEAQIRAARIVAPFSGTVTLRHAEPGEMVREGQPVVTLADLGRLRIVAEADEAST